MKEWEKAQAGFLYDASYDREIVKAREKCADLCFAFNNTRPSDHERQNTLLKQIIPDSQSMVIAQPFYCDYGTNITLGANFYSNHNLTILDGAHVTIGDNVFIAPNCVITTAGHALDAAQRIKGLEIALPIHIGDNVWIGANVTILPGVSIGSDTIIAAGSVVSRDIPESVIAAGVPCHIIRRITEADQNRYPVYRDKTSR